MNKATTANRNTIYGVVKANGVRYKRAYNDKLSGGRRIKFYRTRTPDAVNKAAEVLGNMGYDAYVVRNDQGLYSLTVKV